MPFIFIARIRAIKRIQGNLVKTIQGISTVKYSTNAHWKAFTLISDAYSPCVHDLDACARNTSHDTFLLLQPWHSLGNIRIYLHNMMVFNGFKSYGLALCRPVVPLPKNGAQNMIFTDKNGRVRPKNTFKSFEHVKFNTSWVTIQVTLSYNPSMSKKYRIKAFIT